jgi:hypothetical protein
MGDPPKDLLLKQYMVEKEDDAGGIQQVSGAFGEREALTEEQLKEHLKKQQESE